MTFPILHYLDLAECAGTPAVQLTPPNPSCGPERFGLSSPGLSVNHALVMLLALLLTYLQDTYWELELIYTEHAPRLYKAFPRQLVFSDLRAEWSRSTPS